MAAVPIIIIAEKLLEAALWVTGLLAAGVVVEKAIDAAKESEDEFDQEETKACVTCGTTTKEAAKSNVYNAESTKDEEGNENTEGENTPNSDIQAEDIEGKTRDEIRDLAKEKGLEPFGDKDDPDYPRKWRDPDTKKERLRLDRGHIDKTTGKPYNDPKAAVDHTHAYDKAGNKIKNPVDNNPHFPTKQEVN